MNPTFAALIKEKFKAVRDLAPCTATAEDIAPSSSPPTKKISSTTVPPLIRSTSGSTASSSSALGEERQTMRQDANSGMQSWSVAFQVATATVLTWAAKGNTFIREHASVCWTGDFCELNRDDCDVPEEIFIRNSPSEACSVVGDKETDIELKPISFPRQSFYRKSHWIEIPDDPVDEVSLKGPSFECSSDEDDSVGFVDDAAKARSVRE